jgi:hypothetical protein
MKSNTSSKQPCTSHHQSPPYVASGAFLPLVPRSRLNDLLARGRSLPLLVGVLQPPVADGTAAGGAAAAGSAALPPAREPHMAHVCLASGQVGSYFCIYAHIHMQACRCMHARVGLPASMRLAAFSRAQTRSWIPIPCARRPNSVAPPVVDITNTNNIPHSGPRHRCCFRQANRCRSSLPRLVSSYADQSASTPHHSSLLWIAQVIFSPAEALPELPPAAGLAGALRAAADESASLQASSYTTILLFIDY